MRLTFLLLAGIMLSMSGCDKKASSKPKVLATTSMIADAAKAIGGDHVEVDCLMPPPTDPHKYTAAAGDLERIRRADLVLYNGLHLEGKITDILEGRAKKARTVAIAEGLPDLRPADESIEGGHDPHVWFDVKLWMKAVEKVRDALIEMAPDHADDFRKNATTYLAQLESLDKEVREQLATVPAERRVLITAHDAFGYFGRAYGYEVKGLQGLSTASDTSTRDIQELADIIGTKKIKAVFGESSVPENGVQAVLEAVKNKYKFEVKMAEELLYSDALGNPGSGADTYVGMVRHNVNAIVKALRD